MSHEVLCVRLGRSVVTVMTCWPFVLFEWNRIPNLLTSFGWTFFWHRWMR